MSTIDWRHGSGSIGWKEHTLELTGEFVGTSYHIVRAISLDYGWTSRNRGRKSKPPQWNYSYSVLVGRKEFRLRRQDSRLLRRAHIGRRSWVLLTEQNVYVTSAYKLSELQEYRENLHMEIAARLLQDLPAIDTLKRRRWG